jgi:uncharacterized membrane protein YfcA
LKKNNVKKALIGIVTGFANGLFGSGGGTIVVPAIEKFLDTETHKAHASAIAIILPLSILSTFIYGRNVIIDWRMLIYVCIGGVIGGYLGAKFLGKISSKWLHRIFGLFMIIAAVRMII